LQLLPKIGCHGNVPKGIKKRRSGSRQFTQIYLSFGEKIVKIGPVPEIALFMLKKEINASKIYSPVGKCAERAKLE